MPINLRSLSIALVLAGIISGPALAATDSSDVLLRGAKKWVEKDRADLAKNMLQKLILIEPNSTEALYMLGNIEMKNGKPEEAQRYLQRLEQTSPNSPRTRELSNAINGKTTLSPTPVVKNEIIKPPAVHLVAVKTAPPKNKKGKAVTDKAKETKQPLTTQKQEEIKPAVADTPEDITIDPDIIARTDALDAMADGKLDEAEASLLEILKRRPQDPEVLGGLGLIKQRHGNPAEAETWFDQALQAAQAGKSETGRWVDLLEMARFWKNLKAANILLDENKLPEAEAAITQALAVKPGYPDALAVLGNIKSASNNLAEAEPLYREALKTEGYNVSAIYGLTRLLSQTQRSSEALALIERVLQDYPSEWSKKPESKASILREEGRLYLEAGKTSQAMKALETAVAANPKDAWVRFSLARLYISLDLAPLARNVMQEGVTLNPKDPDMHYVRALILLGMEDYAGGIDSLNQIPETSLTKDMIDARNHALFKYHFHQAEYKFAHGDRKEAIRIMSVAQIQAQENYSATEQVAEGWFQLGLQKQGLSAMRKLPQPVPLKTQIYFASLLNRASQDQELANYLPTLHIPDSADETSKKYRATIQDIEFAMAGRQFDKLMKAGKTEQAQQFADTILNANQLSNAEYFKIHRRYFSRAELPGNAISLLNQEKEQNPNEPSVRWDLANAYHEDKQDSNAQRELDELLSLTRGDDVDMRLRIASLQQNVGDSAGSRQTLNDLMERYPNNTDVLLQAGNIARADGKYNQAMHYYQQISEQAGKPAPAAEPVAIKVAEKPAPDNILLDLLPAKSVQEESVRSRTSLAPALQSTAESEKIYRTAIASDVSKAKYVPNTTTALAEQQMASIASNRSAKIEAGLDIQSKTATSGTSTYNAIEIPVLARFPIGYEAHGTLQVDLVNVDAGALPNTFNDAALFGKVQAFTAPPLQPVAQSASGTSIGLGYEQDSVRADLGVIGIGFPVSNVVGGIVHGGNMGRLSYSLNLSRRPYTGSLISYAGARDTVSGTVWGGVTNTGLSLYLSTTLSSAAMGSFNVSTMASYGLLRGQNVLNNDRLYLRLAVDQDIYSSDDMVLNLGLNANFMRFSKNESFYTFGHGGYYSPQNSLSFGLPLELIGRSDLLSYQLKASVSYSRTKEDAAAFYPNDPALQSRAAVSFLPAGYAQAAYPGGSGGGFGYGLRAATEYRLTPNFAMGGRFNMERSAYYAPNSLLIYGRYMFNPETGPVKMRPEPVIPYSQY